MCSENSRWLSDIQSVCSQETTSANDIKSIVSYSQCYSSSIQPKLFSEFRIINTLKTDNKIPDKIV